MTQRVVILGGGFAGMTLARALIARSRRGEIAVTVVNRANYMLFTPMLPEVSSGNIEARHITPALRAALPRAAIVVGDVTGIDAAARTVAVDAERLAGTTTLEYDHLVIAVGAENSTHGVPGAADHTLPLKTVTDALALRSAVIGALEAAAAVHDDAERRRLTRFVVVGGGFTGVEAAGELFGFLREAARFYPRIETDDIEVVLVAGGKALLPQLDPRVGATAKTMLEERGLRIVFDDEVSAVDAGGVSLASGERLESRTVVWSAGVRPSPLLAHLGVDLSKHHAVVVERDLSVPGHAGVWALGDSAQVPKAGGGDYAPTAQNAVAEAKQLARNILASVRGGRTKPFRYENLGMMASLGRREGVASFANGTLVTGLAAWFLWRTYYLSQLPGLDRKVRVVLDWTLTLPFPEDIASIR